MKALELKKIIREEIKKALKDVNEDPASNLLGLLAAPDFKRYMDRLSDRISDQEFMTIKNLYTKLYEELKKHE
jgi:hypothetical protein